MAIGKKEKTNKKVKHTSTGPETLERDILYIADVFSQQFSYTLNH